MSRGIRLAAALLALTFTGGCGTAPAAPSTPPEPDSPSGAVAYVPLDDRPDNAERVVYLANSLGYRLEMPEADWYRTRLDGQPLNGNGTQYGDPERLYQWVLEQEAAGCDRYILSLDQLLSGGLVNSRHVTEPLTVWYYPDGSVTDSELLTLLLEALAEDEGNEVWLLDTVMRLAPTSGYDGCGLTEYNDLRTYGMAARPDLSGDALTVDNIVSGYRLSPDGSPVSVETEAPLTEDMLRDYLAARERKLRLTAGAQNLLSQPGYEGFHLLIGIDDSSAEDSIQKNEIAYFRARLREGDWLLSGVDDLAFKAVTKLYLSQSAEANGSLADRGLDRVHIDYYGGTEDRPACAYDSQPLNEIVEEHLDFFGLREASREDAGFQLVVLTQPEDWDSRAAYAEAVVERLNENEALGLPTILMDAGNGSYGTAFHDLLVKRTRLGRLIAYSGFLDMAIVTGTALSHGVARYVRLADGGDSAYCHQAFQKSLTESVVLDLCYRNTVREELISHVQNELGGSAGNFYQPPLDIAALEARLTERMGESARRVLKNLSGSNLLLSLDTSEEGSLAGWGTVSLSGWTFPWYRTFEVRMDIAPGPLEAPHRGLFG